VSMPAMSPAAIRQQLQKRLHALEETKTLYSERAKMFLGDRGAIKKPVETHSADDLATITPPKGATTSSAQAIRQQIFHRLQQLEENKAKYTERAKQFLDRERKDTTPLTEKEKSCESPVPGASSPVKTKLMPAAGLVRSQMDSKVSQGTQAAIRSGVVHMQMQGVVTSTTQDAIKEAFQNSVRNGIESSRDHCDSAEDDNLCDVAEFPLTQSRAVPDSPDPRLSSVLSHSQLSSSSHPSSSPKQTQSPCTPHTHLNDSFKRANAKPLRSPGIPTPQQQRPTRTPLTLDQMDRDVDGVDREEFESALAQLRTPIQPQTTFHPPITPLETVVQALHESVMSLASDEDVATEVMFERMFSSLTQQPGSKHKLLSELRQIAGDCAFGVLATGNCGEFECLVQTILDECFEDFSTLNGHCGVVMGCAELNTLSVACLGVPITQTVMERCGMKDDQQPVSCQSFKELVCREQLQYSHNTAELCKVLCRVQGWNGGLAQREPSTELSPSLMQAPLSPLRSAVMQHAEESLNFDHISPISRNSSPSVSFSPQGVFSQEGINTLTFSQESERALHTPGGSHERSRSSRHRQPAGNVPSHISLLEEPVNDDTFLEPFPSSKRRLHTEDEPIVASPHAASMSPVIMNSSSSMSPNKSLLREATAPSALSPFHKVHTLSPEMAATIIREAAKEPAMHSFQPLGASRSPAHKEYEHEQYASPPPARSTKQSEPQPAAWAQVAEPERGAANHIGSGHQTSGHRRPQGKKIVPQGRMIAPFRRSSAASLSYDDFVKEQASVLTDPAIALPPVSTQQQPIYEPQQQQPSHGSRRREPQNQNPAQRQPRSVVAEHVMQGNRNQRQHNNPPHRHSSRSEQHQQPRPKQYRKQHRHQAAIQIQIMWRGYLARRFFAWLLRKRKKDQRKRRTGAPGQPRSAALGQLRSRATLARQERPTERSLRTRNQFDEIDTDGDSKISSAEFASAVNKGQVTMGTVRRSPAAAQQGAAVRLAPRVQQKLAAGFLGWRTRRILALPVVQDIVLEIQDTRNVIGDMTNESAPDTFLLARLETQRQSKQVQLASILGDSRWVQMASQPAKPRRKSNTAAVTKKQPLRRGEGRAVHMVHKKPEAEPQPPVASPPLPGRLSPTMAVQSPPIQTAGRPIHSPTTVSSNADARWSNADDGGFGVGGWGVAAKEVESVADLSVDMSVSNMPDQQNESNSPKPIKKPFLKRKTKTVKIVQKKSKSDWSDVKARTNTNRDGSQQLSSGTKQIDTTSPSLVTNNWASANVTLPEAFKDAGTTAQTIDQMHQMYANMFDFTEIEVGQPLDFVRPLTDWIGPDTASAIPQLDVSSNFFVDF